MQDRPCRCLLCMLATGVRVCLWQDPQTVCADQRDVTKNSLGLAKGECSAKQEVRQRTSSRLLARDKKSRMGGWVGVRDRQLAEQLSITNFMHHLRKRCSSSCVLVQASCPRLYSHMCMTGSCGDLDGPSVHMHAEARVNLIAKMRMTMLKSKMLLRASKAYAHLRLLKSIPASVPKAIGKSSSFFPRLQWRAMQAGRVLCGLTRVWPDPDQDSIAGAKLGLRLHQILVGSFS